jgi:hypothetical protein
MLRSDPVVVEAACWVRQPRRHPRRRWVVVAVAPCWAGGHPNRRRRRRLHWPRVVVVVTVVVVDQVLCHRHLHPRRHHHDLAAVEVAAGVEPWQGECVSEEASESETCVCSVCVALPVCSCSWAAVVMG